MRFSKGNSPVVRRKELLKHLQVALTLEHATIPPYLCALYSIKDDGKNDQSVAAIRSVVVEEMLHMALVANVMNAIGGKPDVLKKGFIAEYPTFLPMSDQAFQVGLEKFSPSAIETFLQIEKPAAPGAKPQHDAYATIGQFYFAIQEELKDFVDKFGERKLFTKAGQSKQLGTEFYYNGGGDIIPVKDLETAQLALRVIVDQGEGFDHTICTSEDQIFGERKDIAHYFKFLEIKEERFFSGHCTPKAGPMGDPLRVDYDSVFPAVFRKKVKEYPELVRPKLRQFHRTYSKLLRAIDASFNGKQSQLVDAVAFMYEVKYEMIALMKIPIDEDGHTAGPTFKYVR